MNQLKPWIKIAALCLFGGLSSCGGTNHQLNRRITLWRKDKIPYGTFIAYEGLPHLFPDADITINRESPSSLHTSSASFSSGSSYYKEESTTLGKKAYIIITPRMDPDESEMNAIMNFVGQGNHVFISAFRFGDSLLHTLNIRQGGLNKFFPDEPESRGDSLRVSVYHPITHDSLSFMYPGDQYDSWASSLDSQYASILGRDHYSRPNFIRFRYNGGGSIYLHFAPLALSNFFLLHKDNKSYYEDVFSYMPYNVREVIWDEYFRYDRTKEFSTLGYILNNRSLRWAFWLLLGLFLLIYLFESKRKQRIVPVINAVRNTSLDFVKTIGRLYYQRRDNHNLALKMVAHFQDHVRNRYNLPVSAMDEAFVERLSYKSGFHRQSLGELVEYMKQLPLQAYVADEELLDFHRQLEEFYKQV